VSLPETMARLDAMFAAPAFDALSEVTATGLQLSMADAMTGQTMRIQDATARLTRRQGQLTLTVGGALEGSRDSRLDIAILRRAAEAETEIATVFRDLAARDLATVSPALAWLDLMRAPISGRLALQLGDDGTVGDLEARLDIGAGRVWLGQDSTPLGFDRIGADMLYDPDTRRLTFSALRLDAPAALHRRGPCRRGRRRPPSSASSASAGSRRSPARFSTRRAASRAPHSTCA
jgi:hypothetical protein